MITVNALQKIKAKGEKITILTAYESSFAALIDNTDVNVLLVGGSLGTTAQDRQSTLPVGLQDMCYHTECVVRGTRNTMIVSGLLFDTYQQSKEQALAAAAELIAAGAHMVKLEDGVWMAEVTEFLQVRGIPVCTHINPTPRFVLAFGGYKVRGRGDKAETSLGDAKAHDVVGAVVVPIERVPIELTKKATGTVSYPTIGIDTGADYDGQVLVMHDMLGVFPGKTAKFVKNFMRGKDSIQAVVKAYINEVKTKTFPSAEYTFVGQNKLQAV